MGLSGAVTLGAPLELLPFTGPESVRRGEEVAVHAPSFPTRSPSSPSQIEDNRTQPEGTWLVHAGFGLSMRGVAVLSSLYPEAPRKVRGVSFLAHARSFQLGSRRARDTHRRTA